MLIFAICLIYLHFNMLYKQFLIELDLLILKGFRYHHSAKARGYQRASDYYIESYSGKYGQGYIIHYPTQEDNFSNRYHRIEYYL